VAFGAGINKRFGDHTDVIAFIDANGFAALAFYFVTVALKRIQPDHPVFVAAQYLSLTNFVILPQFLFTGRTF
jgi:hypothetical protein